MNELDVQLLVRENFTHDPPWKGNYLRCHLAVAILRSATLNDDRGGGCQLSASSKAHATKSAAQARTSTTKRSRQKVEIFLEKIRSQDLLPPPALEGFATPKRHFSSLDIIHHNFFHPATFRTTNPEAAVSMSVSDFDSVSLARFVWPSTVSPAQIVVQTAFDSHSTIQLVGWLVGCLRRTKVYSVRNRQRLYFSVRSR